MDNLVARLSLEEISLFQRMEDPAEVDTVFKTYSLMKQALIRLILPKMSEFSTMFFIVDNFELIKKEDGTFRVDVNYFDMEFKKGIFSFELGEMENVVENKRDSPEPTRV